MSTDIVLDAGTYKTVLYSAGKVVLEQPSAVAVDSETYEPIAFGEEAKRMFGKTPASVSVIFPIERGAVSDYELAEEMIVHFIKSTFGNRIVKPRVIAVVPSDVTTVQHHSVANAISAAGCRNISTIESTVASAVGLDIDISKPNGNMIVDIGGGTVNIATVSMGAVAQNDTLRLGSIDFDDAIIKYVRYSKNVLIGGQTAEHIKRTIGSAITREFDITMRAKGRNIFTGLPEVFTVSASEIYTAINDLVMQICSACQNVLESTDPDIVADISKNGIYLLGGGAKLYGMDACLEKYLSVKVNRVEDDTSGALKGAYKVLKNPSIIKNSDYQFRSIQKLIVNDEI